MVWGIYRVGGGSDRYENLVLALRFEIFRVPRNRMLRSDRYFYFAINHMAFILPEKKIKFY